MTNWNTGSISTHVGTLIGWGNVGAISGTTLNNIVLQEVNFANTFTNDNIDSTNIQDKYQPSIIGLVQAQVLIGIQAQLGGITEASLGGLTINQRANAGGNIDLATKLRDDAIAKLKELGRYVRFRRVIAGV